MRLPLASTSRPRCSHSRMKSSSNRHFAFGSKAALTIPRSDFRLYTRKRISRRTSGYLGFVPTNEHTKTAANPTGKSRIPIFGNRVKRKICANRKYFCFSEPQISAT